MSFGKIIYREGFWVITEIAPHVAIKLKRFFPKIPQTSIVPFLLKETPDLASDLEWFMQRFPLEMSGEDRQRLNRNACNFTQVMQNMTKVMSGDWKPPTHNVFKPNRQPYRYQMQAAQLGRSMGGLLVMDGVGMGKTVTGLAAVAEAGFLPANIVVEPHLIEQWGEEFIDGFTDLRWHGVRSKTPYSLPMADIYIWSYNVTAGWVDYFADMPYQSVVFDEIQNLRTGDSTDKGKGAAAMIAGRRLVMGLSATPIYNYGSEIFNIIEFIRPGALGTWQEFVTEWCEHQGTHWLVKDPAALGSYMLSNNIAVNRSEDDVGQQRIPINRLVYDVPYDAEKAMGAEQLAHALALQVTSGSFERRGQAARELDALARHTTGVAKARGVAQFADLVAKETPIILAGWHRDVYDIWLKDLAHHKPVMFTGSETKRQKRQAKKDFISGRSRIMIMSNRSGAGTDGLQEVCHTIIHGELDWSPMVHKQITGRAARPGQKNEQVDEIYLVTDQGSDPTILEVNGIKSSQAHGITDPLNAPVAKMNDGSRMKKLAEAYLNGRR